MAYLEMGLYDRAAEEIQQATALEPLQQDYKFGLGEIYEKLKLDEPAAGASEPPSPFTPTGAKPFPAGHDPGPAGSRGRGARRPARACRLEPKSSHYFAEAAAVERELGAKRQAADLLATASRLDGGNLEYVLDLAELQRELGQLDAAVESYRAAVELKPRRAETHFELGYTLFLANRSDEARESLATCFGIDPDTATPCTIWDAP